MKRFSKSLLIGSGLLLTGSMAAASGMISMPEIRQNFPSFEACVARLDTVAAEQAASVQPKVRAADGSTREVVLERQSNGVERLGDQHARYAGRISANHGWPRPDLQQMEYRSSWSQQVLECRGAEMTINNASGYTLNSFGPMESAQGNR